MQISGSRVGEMPLEEAQQEETAILRSLSGPPNSYKQEGDE